MCHCESLSRVVAVSDQTVALTSLAGLRVSGRSRTGSLAQQAVARTLPPPHRRTAFTGLASLNPRSSLPQTEDDVVKDREQNYRHLNLIDHCETAN